MESDSSKTILVVDDDCDIRESIRMLLEDAAYRVAEAANGQEALDYLRAAERLPSLILLDLAMPVMSGREFRERQRSVSAWSAVPVFILSAAADIRERTAGMAPDLVIPKPFDLEFLFGAIAAAVGQQVCG